MQGVVSKISGFPWQDKILYSFTLSGSNQSFSVGERKPSVLNEGTSIQFDTAPGNKGRINAKNIVPWNNPDPIQNVPVKQFTATSGSKEGYWEAKEARDVSRDKRIERMSARNSALEMVSIVLTAGALKLPKDQKDQVEVIEKLVAKYQDDFLSDNSGVAAEPEVAKEEAVEETAGEWN